MEAMPVHDLAPSMTPELVSGLMAKGLAYGCTRSDMPAH